MKRYVMAVVMVSIMVGLMPFTGVQEGFSAEKKLVIAGRDGTYGKALQLAVDTYLEKNPGMEIIRGVSWGASLFRDS